MNPHPWNETGADVQRVRLFLCDSIAWRIDPFVDAVGRLGEEARRLGCRLPISIGYRLRDDLAVVTVGDADDGDSVRLVDAAFLPGLRALHVPGPPQATHDVRARALASCDVLVEGHERGRLREELRGALGLGGDARAARRVEVNLALRFEADGRWHEGTTRDLAAGGIFVQTNAPAPGLGVNCKVEVTLPGELWPLTGTLAAVRVAPGGFGARLQLTEQEEQRLARAIVRLRPAPVPDARRAAPRAPARYVVRFSTGQELAHAYTTNISSGGVYIRTPTPPPAGSRIRLALALPDGIEFELAGKVAHSTAANEPGGRPAGFGVSFDDLGGEVRERLEMHVAALLARPRLRVLAAEVDEALRTELGGALRRERCELLDARTGEELFARLLEEILGLDVVVLGAREHDESALRLLERIRVTGGETALPVVVVADRVPEDEVAWMRAGADAVVDRAQGIAAVVNAIVRAGEARLGRPF